MAENAFEAGSEKPDEKKRLAQELVAAEAGFARAAEIVQEDKDSYDELAALCGVLDKQITDLHLIQNELFKESHEIIQRREQIMGSVGEEQELEEIAKEDRNNLRKLKSVKLDLARLDEKFTNTLSDLKGIHGGLMGSIGIFKSRKEKVEDLQRRIKELGGGL